MSELLTLEDLPYAYDALMPVISADIMELHHKKHHQAYVNNFNAAYIKMQEAVEKKDARLIASLSKTLRFNAGGHANHKQFWAILTPPANSSIDLMDSALRRALIETFGSIEKMIAQFNQEAVAVQGSGWGFLQIDKNNKRISITTTANQDPLEPLYNAPLIGIDVWEHAYYLQYVNNRADYLNNIWSIINWIEVSRRYIEVISV